MAISGLSSNTTIAKQLRQKTPMMKTRRSRKTRPDQPETNQHDQTTSSQIHLTA